MFFYLSKILWFLVNPGNILLILLVVGVALLWTRRYKTGRMLLLVCALITLIVSTVPFGTIMMLPLENRFSINRNLPERVDGIITLGGIVNEVVTRARGQMSIGGGVERLTELATLSKQYPNAKLVFSGGSGKLLSQNIKEADAIKPLLIVLGIDPERMIYENNSRNTYENAVLTKKLVMPKLGENWILITSAFHMPRAVATFRKAGWNIIPYPVDYSFVPNQAFTPLFSLSGGLVSLDSALHEWLGLTFYWLTGKSDQLFPAP